MTLACKCTSDQSMLDVLFTPLLALQADKALGGAHLG